jgi:TonB family protein
MSTILNGKSKLLAAAAALLVGQAAMSGGAAIAHGDEHASKPVPISTIPHDGDYLPANRAQPKYPRGAFDKGIEGSVILEFTVEKDGSVPVGSIKVVGANPAGYFEKVATNAAVQFRYTPMMVKGKATAVSGVRYKFSFELAG